jgi:tripartite-type tricarboxylate transporter receptor subunit TctC
MRAGAFSKSFKVVCIVAAVIFAHTPFAQEKYPNKPIKLINPWVAGGNVDAFARVIAPKMSETLGQPIVIDTRPGANGTIGHAAAAKAVPDGYTLLLSHVGPMAIMPALQPNLPYDPTADFAPIGQIVSGPQLLVVRSDIPVRSVKELIDYAKANPGKLTYGSVGIGSGNHLSGEMLGMMSGINILHVPYKGAPPIVTDMLGGRIAMSFMPVTLLLPHVQSGSLRAIAITSLARSPLLPDLPTVSETLPGFEFNSWHGLVAPAGTPTSIVMQLHEALVKALAAPDVVEWLRQNALEPSGSRPDEFANYIKREIKKWGKVVKEAKVTLN